MIRAEFDKAAATVNRQTAAEWSLVCTAPNSSHGCELAAIMWRDEEIITVDCRERRAQWLVNWAAQVIKICTIYDAARMMHIRAKQIELAEQERRRRALLTVH